jgi:hypothetical protein
MKLDVTDKVIKNHIMPKDTNFDLLNSRTAAIIRPDRKIK